MKTKVRYFSLCFLFCVGCWSQREYDPVYESGTLRIEKLTAHTFVHVSYLETEDFGKVACNGMIVVDEGEALVFDTPTSNETSTELINWIENQNGAQIKAVVATHFHEDCLGGLEVFHLRNIPSYALETTRGLAAHKEVAVPQIGFQSHLELNVGKEKVLVGFQGEGHTVDNIIGYFTTEGVLFGGCLVKAIGAGKGNLADANVHEWSNTVQSLKVKYPKIQTVIPGHGDTGGVGLLDYTITLFKDK